MVSSEGTQASYTAFRGHSRVARGSLGELAIALYQLAQQDPSLVLVFEDQAGSQLDLDLRGSLEDVKNRYGAEAVPDASTPDVPRGRGRPRLGVVGHEVTLLPRHWEWLRQQRGGPSATLRRIVDEARAAHADRDRVRHAQDAINRFISAVAGDLPGFEEANRALYAGDGQSFAQETAGWPQDIRRYIDRFRDAAFGTSADT